MSRYACGTCRDSSSDEADPPHVPLYLAQRLFAAIATWKRDGRIDGRSFGFSTAMHAG